MHAILSYRGNRPTNTRRPPVPNKQTGLITIHCASKLSTQCNYSKRKTNRAWFTRLLQHLVRKRSRSILTIPERARGGEDRDRPLQWQLGAADVFLSSLCSSRAQTRQYREIPANPNRGPATDMYVNERRNNAPRQSDWTWAQTSRAESCCELWLRSACCLGPAWWCERRLVAQTTTHTHRLRIEHLLKRSDHITDAFVSLHWLWVPERIQYKVAVLGYRVLYGSAPRYLGPLTHIADVPGRRTSVQPPPIVSSWRRSNSPLSAAELFRLPLSPFGTRSMSTSSVHLLYSHFNIIGKLSCSEVHSRTFFCS